LAADSTPFFRICAAALLLLLAALYFRSTNHVADKADAPEELTESSRFSGASAPAKKKIFVAPDRKNQARESGLSDFHLLLSSDDYESLIDIYDRIYVDSSISESAPYRDLILERASELIQGGNPDKASDLLNQYLSIFYADVDALIILGRAYRNQRLRLNAVEAFQKAHQYEHRRAVRQLIINQENNIIGELVQDLKEQNQNASIIDLYENLTQVQPEVPGYFIGLANAYAAEHRYDEAIRSLRYIQSDIKEGPQAHALIDKFTGLKARQ
jgi:tetratricopeptide (TPR) repeat protein